ncbi:MAG: ABC transporter permease [Candidatus Latescibacteria bacterium]|nr:ABC transporter permease [Candidatus Latescibacterota bacterium]NIM20922.1 ABC transporter permease [Candidatus Latescibacterota bacterium]NIM65057.1 ABC transporter permease [Candidatus Latescibacterota bacterium]NIO01572.1 ABC transporter permease [Candidatus Latescibacterota bacterium]NIO28089.1 ABC transporter permease [Candidatus Latescibacterota bacterium]
MVKMIAIYKRELAYFFNSIIAYVVITIFILLAGYFFYNLLAYFNLISMQAMQNPYTARQLSLTQGVLQPLFGNLSIIMLLIMPLLTMRLLSEERKSGTAELLFTYPVTDWDVILGKYLATGTVFVAMLAMTLLYPLLLQKYASPEGGAVFSGYLGLFLMGMAFISMGLFFSCLGENQIVAGVSTFGFGLFFLIIGWITPFASPTTGKVLEQISILVHFENFAKGVIDTNDVVYYLIFSVFFLFLSSRVLESNRWRS